MKWRGLLLALLLAGCVSTPQATAERDVEAKQFIARPDAVMIYVYRDDYATAEPGTDNTVLYVDGRLIGATLPKTFFRFDVRAGEHLLHGFGYDQGTLKMDTRSGEIYFVSLQSLGGYSRFTLVPPEIAKRDILRCWRTGRRTSGPFSADFERPVTK